MQLINAERMESSRPFIPGVALSVGEFLEDGNLVSLTVKSGILTARVEYMPKALFRALSQAQLAALPPNAACLVFKLLLGGTLTIAQIKIASHALGTIIALAMNKWRIRWGETSMNGN